MELPLRLPHAKACTHAHERNHTQAVNEAWSIATPSSEVVMDKVERSEMEAESMNRAATPSSEAVIDKASHRNI
eukprot:3598615-Pleurochrysis_carterae.AAC.1